MGIQWEDIEMFLNPHYVFYTWLRCWCLSCMAYTYLCVKYRCVFPYSDFLLFSLTLERDLEPLVYYLKLLFFHFTRPFSRLWIFSLYMIVVERISRACPAFASSWRVLTPSCPYLQADPYLYTMSLMCQSYLHKVLTYLYVGNCIFAFAFYYCY